MRLLSTKTMTTEETQRWPRRLEQRLKSPSHEMFHSEEGLRKIVESVVQVALNTEIEGHLQARRYERTDSRRGYRNGYKRRRAEDAGRRAGSKATSKPRHELSNAAVRSVSEI